MMGSGPPLSRMFLEGSRVFAIPIPRALRHHCPRDRPLLEPETGSLGEGSDLWEILKRWCVSPWIVTATRARRRATAAWSGICHLEQTTCFGQLMGSQR